jgi:general secretion pathway protein G
MLELTLVLVIMAALMAVAAINVVGAGNRAKIRTTKASMKVIQSGIKQYFLDHSEYPTSLQLLVDKEYLDPDIKDSWGSAFFYDPRAANGAYDLISFGKDKVEGTEDDIDVWTMNDE